VLESPNFSFQRSSVGAVDSKTGRRTNLKKYLSHGGKWQFFPVFKVSGRPKPEFVVIDGKARRSTSGTFYLGVCRR
jgi:hypothetical protein